MKKKEKKLKQYLSRVFFLTGNKTSRRLLLLAGFFIVIYLLLFFTMLPPGVSVELGMPSPQTIYARRDAVDYYSTNKLKKEAADAVPEVYDHIPSVLEEGKKTLFSIFQEIRLARGLGEEDERLTLLKQKIDMDIPRDSLQALVRLSNENLNDLQGRVERIYNEIMLQGIKEKGEQAAMKQVMQEVNLLPFSPEVKLGMEKLFTPLVRPNMIYNEAATEASREAARQALEPVRILKNSLIVQEGERVTEKHIAQLEALGLLGSPSRIDSYLGLFLLLVLVFVVVGYYVYLFNREFYENTNHISLLGLIVILTLVLGLAARYFSGYLIPVAMASMLITVLFESRLAVIFNVVLALFFGFVVEGELSFFVVTLLGGLVAVYSVAQLKRRSDLTRAGIYVAAVNVVAIIAIFLLSRGFQFEYDYLREFSIALLAGMGNGLLSAVMAIGLLPFLESAFGLTTAITLLELADPGRPLLRKLLVETPGTYHHSILVGNLAEAASEAVGADPLLSRVAAFYHDIGKVRRPYFFVENQFSSNNPHKRISPNLSSLIIRSHVKDGLELAREAKLPLPIQEIIGQHHGKSLISFFYQQALENKENREKNVLPEEDEFRYEGPLPQSKEAAVIMLADAVEAAVRSLSQPAAGRIEGIIRRIIKEKLNDGQLDEAPLTLKDLDRIGDTFAHILSGLFHQRIEYPEKELRADLERGRNKNGGFGKQLTG
ncbi:MAG: HDIG domain-containing metalloprotein [Bacillota bacterium]